MSVVVVATIFPAPGQQEAVARALVRAIEEVHGEDGCELYALNEGADRLVMVEKWASAQALEQHSAGPALQRLAADLAGKTVGAPDVQVLQPHPAGTAVQGVVQGLSRPGG
jgi:quinol monooxygenase YgiN